MNKITEAIKKIKEACDLLPEHKRETLQNALHNLKKDIEPLLIGPCIAMTRCGDIIVIQRSLSDEFPFIYKDKLSNVVRSVTTSGHCHQDLTPSDCDVVSVVRLLTEREILDWQLHEIEPNVPTVSEFLFQLDWCI